MGSRFSSTVCLYLPANSAAVDCDSLPVASSGCKNFVLFVFVFLFGSWDESQSNYILALSSKAVKVTHYRKWRTTATVLSLLDYMLAPEIFNNSKS